MSGVDPVDQRQENTRDSRDDPTRDVDDFLRALDSIEAEIRAIPDVVFVEFSLTRGQLEGVADNYIDRTLRQIYIVLLQSKSIDAHWESLSFDLGGPEFPFIWSPTSGAVCEAFSPDVTEELEPVTFAVWYYLDAWRSPVPQDLLDKFQVDECDRDLEAGLAATFYKTDTDRVSNVMRSVQRAWTRAPEAVIREFGDLSRLLAGDELPTGESVATDLWWPAVLLTLAIRGVDAVLTAEATSHTPHSFGESLDRPDMSNAAVDEAHAAFESTTWTISLSSQSLMAATSCALRAFRRIAENPRKNSAQKTEDELQAGENSEAPPKPTWDSETRVLKFDGQERKFAAQTGDNVLDVLTAFESKEWPEFVKNPLNDSERTRDTLRTINRSSVGLKIHSDGNNLRWNRI